MGTGGTWMTRSDFRRSWKPWLRGTALGFPIGAMPAGGAEVPTFLSYALEKKLTKHPEEFGHGAIEGVAGPEAANNASAAGVLVPLLTLGLPTSATAAVMIAAFQSYGIRPGPLLFQSEGALVWALIASLYVGNVLLLVLNLPLVGLWVKVLQIPRHYLYAGIMTFAALGAYAINGVRDDLLLLLAIGVLGFGMRRFGYPIAPAVIGLILGPIAEEQLRRTLAISQGDPMALVESPFAAVLYSLLALAVVVTVVLRLRRPRPAVDRERLTV
jgi:putative tricarboxylic transport membrane protein